MARVRVIEDYFSRIWVRHDGGLAVLTPGPRTAGPSDGTATASRPRARSLPVLLLLLVEQLKSRGAMAVAGIGPCPRRLGVAARLGRRRGSASRRRRPLCRSGCHPLRRRLRRLAAAAGRRGRGRCRRGDGWSRRRLRRRLRRLAAAAGRRGRGCRRRLDRPDGCRQRPLVAAPTLVLGLLRRDRRCRRRRRHRRLIAVPLSAILLARRSDRRLRGVRTATAVLTRGSHRLRVVVRASAILLPRRGDRFRRRRRAGTPRRHRRARQRDGRLPDRAGVVGPGAIHRRPARWRRDGHTRGDRCRRDPYPGEIGRPDRHGRALHRP